MHYVKCKKPTIKGYILYDLCNSGKGNAIGAENISVIARGWGQGERVDYKGV